MELNILSNKLQQDLEFARRICDELKSGNQDAVKELYIYRPPLLSIARRKLYDISTVDAVMNAFWNEISTKKAICKYTAKNNASLKTYFISILTYKIIDENIKHEKHTKTTDSLSENEHHLNKLPADEHIPDKTIIDKENQELIQEIVRESVIEMSEKFSKDAQMMEMQLDGLKHEEMAQRLGMTPEAVRKQFTRPQTGTLVRFEKTVRKVLNRRGLSYEEIFS